MPEKAFLGIVKYIDYDRQYISVTDAFQYIVHKRKSFEHERELRAVLWKPTAGDTEMVGDRGMVVPIDLSNLIENIFISPDATPILEEVVSGLKTAYRLSAPVNKSKVNDRPDY